MPGELGAEAIYALARGAGFSPDQAVTMTAIALAESGGNPQAHNPNGEDSRGLWQINVAAMGDPPWAEGLDMFNPQHNAIAAWMVSQEGADIGPWTVTYANRDSPYRQFAEEARAAALAHGEVADGQFDVTPVNSQSAEVSAGDPGAVPFAGAPAAFPPPASASADPALELGDGSLQRFLDAALAQQGDRFVSNATARDNDPNPSVFDCSELVEWAAAQVDVELAESSAEQYLQLKEAGTLISVEDAINTPGALLFKFPGGEPQPGQGRRDGYHVAISLGDGRTMEAMSPSLGVRISEAKDRFGYAALIPGLDYSSPPPTINDDMAAAATALLAPPQPDLPPTAEQLAGFNARSVDTDRDMLPDHFEPRFALDANQPDTDGDGITDGYELIALGTKANSLDTDFDQITDGLELVLGLDPLVADNPDASTALAVPDELHVDTDGDGITDWGEDLAGTNPLDPNTDDDLILDGDEIAARTDPLVADS